MDKEENFWILIRHKEGREKLLDRCIDSIDNQNYRNCQIVISTEMDKPLPRGYDIKIIQVPNQHYNLHCNDLKAQVESGWLLFCDDDDALASPTILQDLSNIIVNNYPWKGAYIGQFLRKGIAKPPKYMIENGIIKKGYCGGGCCVLHHSFKDVADWKAMPAADYEWLKELQDKQVPMKFIPLVIQKTFNNGLHGK